MKVNDFQKRPTSGKKNNRDSKSKPSVTKTEETQLETNTNQNKNTNPNISGDKIIESEEENYTQSNIIDKSKSSIEKIDFLDSLAKGSRRDSFINLLDEEAQRIDKINSQKQKLNDINLKENDIEGLYEWKTLFNNSKPMSSYTRINYKKPALTEEIELNKLKSPKVLVDLPDDKMLYFFGKNAFGDNNDGDKKKKDKNKKGTTFRKSNTNNNYNNVSTLSNINKSNTKHLGTSKIRSSKIVKTNRNEKEKGKNTDKDKDKDKESNNIESNKAHNYIKPMSIYGQFNPEDTFYFSNTFSDYYKEDLKSFTNKMPILKAKVKTNSKRLKKTMAKQRIKSSNKEKILYDTIMTDPLILRKQDLIISAERRNPVPLMKSIYKQENPDAVEIKENVKKYFNTMKPFGNDDGTTDYTKNDRWRLSREIARIRTGKNDEENKNENENDYYTGKKRKLILSYYNINDPAIKIFNNLHLDENQIKNNSFEFKKDGTHSSYNIKFEVINKSNESTERNLKREEKKEINNYKVRQRPRTGFKQSRTLSILNNEKIKKPLTSKRPHSSLTRRKYSLSGNKIFDLKDYNELYKDYMPSKRFPVKTNSKVCNTSYNRINQMIKERQLSRKLLSNMNDKYYYFITQPTINSSQPYETLNSTENGKSTVKSNEKRRARPKTASGVRSNTKMGINLDNKSTHSKDSQQKCNYLYFNKCINMSHELPNNNDIQFKGFYGPANCFNKLAGKFYSSSVNVHVKNKRNKKKEILNTYYGKYNEDFQKMNNMKKYDEIF